MTRPEQRDQKRKNKCTHFHYHRGEDLTLIRACVDKAGVSVAETSRMRLKTSVRNAPTT
jgi:hypothetical protein